MPVSPDSYGVHSRQRAHEICDGIYLDMFITENQLDEWVRGNNRVAQGVIVELVARLVAASCPRPNDRRFPLGDSIGQHGPDGILDVELGLKPFVPDGRSFWEISVRQDAGGKATEDYNGLTLSIPEGERLASSFVFVTPLSARRDWEHTWKVDSQGSWLATRRAKQEWRGINIIDGTKLIDWVHQFPAVEIWLAQLMNAASPQSIETPEQRWSVLRSIGEPPTLTPRLFLTGRDEACAKLRAVASGTAVQLKLRTHYPGQVADFVCAFLAELEPEARLEAAGRWLVVSDGAAWHAMTQQSEPLILVADADLDLSGDAGTKLIQTARRRNHAVVFGGPAGGIPDPASVSLGSPHPYQVKEALQLAGYSEERARTLAQKSGGNLSSLLRCLQSLSVLPEWAEGTAASELAIAAILGSWSDSVIADQSVIEGLSGKAYGEWIGIMREIALTPGTPLRHREGEWRFVARYEGWIALAPRLFDDDLTRLRHAAVAVLTERDPQFDLAKGDRYASSIHGKVLRHSHLLRVGLAECLALLGSHSKAASSCSVGNADMAASLAVREILADADWERWASIDTLLPLLAEAAPGEFLDALEEAVTAAPSPFDRMYAEEGDALMGRSHMSGVLWALETLAWDPEHLGRVVLCLGDLAAKDPGGRWSNRPSNSLITILMTWFPQTCAQLDKRVAAVAALLTEQPTVGWRLLLDLLPQNHSTSFGTRKPVWRTTIPSEWTGGVTTREYAEQVAAYAQMAIAVAKTDLGKLAQLIDHLEALSPSAQEPILQHLESSSVVGLPEVDRFDVWRKLVDVVAKHRKFHDAQWALPAAHVDKIAVVADLLAPSAPALRHQRLFGERDFDLHEGLSSYKDESRKLEERRDAAVQEIFSVGGTDAVLTFAGSVQAPWQVGTAFGSTAPAVVDHDIVPVLLASDERRVTQFVSGFVWGRFRVGGWSWADGVDMANWIPAERGQFYAYLPFTASTWERVARVLVGEEQAYWTRTTANPFEADGNLEQAVDQLNKHGRPSAAVRCLGRMLYARQPFDDRRAVEALLGALGSDEPRGAIDVHQVVELIKHLQSNGVTDADDIARIEWGYLQLLDRRHGAAAITLEGQLATRPEFFCQVVRTVYRQRDAIDTDLESATIPKEIVANAYRLLHDWRTPPGSQNDGSFSGVELGRWVDAVKAECSQTGHLSIAMTVIGRVLVYVPADRDGLWIDRGAAAVLNRRDAGDMRSGFRSELFNSRGVHSPSAGREELELSKEFRGKAEAAELSGFGRLATTIRDLANGYQLDAEREAQRDSLEN